MSEQNINDRREHNRARKSAKVEQPGWVHGLRQLYDATVNEPLPQSFEDLLRQLDQDNAKNS